MTDERLTEIVFRDAAPEYSKSVIDDLMRSDASDSVYGWHRYVPCILGASWSELTLGERLVFFVMANERADVDGD